MSLDAQPYTLVIEIERGAHPVQGRVRVVGEDHVAAFTGWTEFAVVIERCSRSGPADGAGTAPSDVVVDRHPS